MTTGKTIALTRRTFVGKPTWVLILLEFDWFRLRINGKYFTHPQLVKMFYTIYLVFFLFFFLRKNWKTLFKPNLRILTQEEHLRKLRTALPVRRQETGWRLYIKWCIFGYLHNPYLSTHEGSCDPLQDQEGMLCFYWNVIVLNVMLVSAIWQRRSALPKHTFPPSRRLLPPHPPIPRPSGSPALSSWFSTCSSFWPAVCLTRCRVWRSGPLSPSIPSSPSPSVSTSSFSTSACLVLSCVWVNQSHFPSFQIWVGIFLVYYTFHCQKLGIFMSSP